ncbi:MAG: MotA/TolQ/ExbB proton channel family protein [Candidatus Schekmanbacteria bacterium]|nr:MotA/TolQ/ExbB proton channel family protein [Candidatus Schekmanbacteria bacterium]
MELSLVEIWGSMSFPVRMVAAVMSAMSMWSLWVAIDKFILFTRAKNQSLHFVGALSSDAQRQHPAKVLELTRDKAYRQSHLAKIANAGMLEFLRAAESPAPSPTARPAAVASGQPRLLERTQHAMERAAVILSQDFKKGFNALATVGSTAPFVGLFGTVIGIINAFQVIKTAGAGAIGQVSGGIAEALIMTAFGLLVAIPSVWMYNFFTARLERIQHEMANVTGDLLDYLEDSAEARDGKRA